ncbi:winged helix-turn-helix transcriptional regulator [Rhodovulum sulfidophilum]|uniref:winged helix-turn-helix transcriptional regulator n=1 Tax=Rhodovulum sulfidophilum TaxID=35806 RepID=UPI0013893D18|nr:helix-turn-helix domain-containing protein [Rhodovulum sulfidophilum]NDK35497.1 helix-turn-helix transcriptional regulator [Rhodovulum sulfidophilum]
MKTPGKPSRGSTTGRPIMVLLDVLGKRWTLRILWELSQGPATFRELQRRCDDISPTMVSKRVGELRELGFVTREAEGYGLTLLGHELAQEFISLEAWANRWAETRLDEQGDRK